MRAFWEGGLKETGTYLEHSDREWIEVLWQWT